MLLALLATAKKDHIVLYQFEISRNVGNKKDAYIFDLTGNKYNNSFFQAELGK